ncbi:ABC transporter permease [Streptomyces sp. NBC_00820]|uniref:ABC transporter permease n=1 Tax=Streptomyces sp. NBC_00820 TaxID=2975842 RepID=UPI002ED384E0|nr:ABC transporter permease [Streptomyces sp. NBC_00820]
MTGSFTAARAAFRLQATLLLRSPGSLQPLFTAPLYTLIFTAMAEHSGRQETLGYAVVVPVLISLWTMALLTAGDLVAQDRFDGTLELLVAAPAGMAVVTTARIAAVTGVSLAAIVECWCTSALVAGDWPPVHHPFLLAAGAVATSFALTCAACLMSAGFVLARSARVFQNALSYPLYLLAGLTVPVSAMPYWVRPLSRLFFLSWSADLLRRSVAAAPVPHPLGRLAATVLLGLVWYGVALLAFRTVLARVRATGTVALV